MNEVIKDLLSRSDEQFDEYVLTRIIELEQQNKRYREALEWYSENSPKGNIADEVLEDKKMSVELSEEIRKFLVTHDSEQRELSREQRELSILKQRLQEQRLQDNLNKLEEMSKRHYELIEKFENQNEELTKVNNKNEV